MTPDKHDQSLKEFGYLPGDYQWGKCRDCNVRLEMVAKHSSRCRPCAVKAKEAKESSPATPDKTNTQDPAKLVDDFDKAAAAYAKEQANADGDWRDEKSTLEAKRAAKAALLAEFTRLSELLECQHKICLAIQSDFKDEIQLTRHLREKVAALSAPSQGPGARTMTAIEALSAGALVDGSFEDEGKWVNRVFPLIQKLRQAVKIDARLTATPSPAPTPSETLTAPHPDDLAVDRFAEAMKAKLAKKRAEGYGGWEDEKRCSVGFLAKLLIEHVRKGDPVDVANFAMMLHHRDGGKFVLPNLAKVVGVPEKIVSNGRGEDR